MGRRKSDDEFPTQDTSSNEPQTSSLEIEMADYTKTTVWYDIAYEEQDGERKKIVGKMHFGSFAPCRSCGGSGPKDRDGRSTGEIKGGMISYEVDHGGTRYTMNAACSCIWGAVRYWAARRHGVTLKFFDRMSTIERGQHLPEPEKPESQPGRPLRLPVNPTRRQHMQQILSVLRERPASSAELCTLTALSEDQVGPAMVSLQLQGVTEDTGVKRQGRPVWGMRPERAASGQAERSTPDEASLDTPQPDRASGTILGDPDFSEFEEEDLPF